MSDKFNPNFPLTLGCEWDARRALDLPGDYGLEYGYRFTPTASQIVTGTYAWFSQPNSVDFRSLHHMAIYEADRWAEGVGFPQFAEGIISASSSTTGGTIVGAGSVQTAIDEAFDDRYVLLDAGSDRVDALITHQLPLGPSRILDITFLLELSPNVTGGGDAVNLDIAGGPTFARVNVTEHRIYRVSCGEIRPGTTPRPWSHTDEPINLRVSRSSGQVRLGFVGCEITFGVENRVGATDCETLPGAPFVNELPGWREFTMLNYPTATATGSPPTGIILNQGTEYIVTATRSNEITGDIVTDSTITMQQRGPAPTAGGLRPNNPQTGTPVEANRDQLGLLSAPTERDRMSALLLASTGAPPAAFRQAGQQPYAGLQTNIISPQFTHIFCPANQVVVARVSVTLRRVGHPGNFVLPIGSTSVTITEAMYDAAEHDAFGWTRFDLPLPVPVTVGPSGVTILVPHTQASNRWEAPILSTEPNFPGTDTGIDEAVSYGAFGGSTGGAFDGVASTSTSDYAICLHSAVPAATGLVVTGGIMTLQGVDDSCESPTFRTLDYAQICWGKIPLISGSPATTGVGVTGFCAWEVERQDADDPVWRQIAAITDYDAICLQDFEGRIGVPTSYRVRLVRTDGQSGPYATVTGFVRTGPSTSTGPPLVTGGCQGLVFTSNESPTSTVAYPYAFESSAAPREEFSFVEAETAVFQRLYMRDYQVMFRPLERGGVRFDRTLLVNALSTPPARLDEGFRSLRDLAWENLTYVCVLDTRGNRWFAAVLVPSGTVREANEVYLASVSIIETTDVPTVVDVEVVP